MKQYNFLSFLILALPAVCIGLFSFSLNKGGDVFEIHLNGKQVHRQFVHVDNSIKTLQLQAFGDNDKIEVFYSHCGQIGTSRMLTLRNGKNEQIKKFKFPDVNNNRSLIGFSGKEIAGNRNTMMNLYYSSNELPNGKLLATFRWTDGKVIANR
jgi:hypothetical protein